MSRKTNQAAVNLIRSFEGCRLKAYEDQGGKLTIGYGHTNGVQADDTITQQTAEKLLEEDIQEIGDTLDELITRPVSDNQYGAVLSFAFNLGTGTLQRSSLLSKLNDGDFNGAADEFLKWMHVKGISNLGLLRRRTAERTLFLTP